jgi:DNA repair exonuclease SbcCD ATPase subunit
MKIELVKFENFGPFVDATFQMSDLGLVLVQGENQLSGSADSNGSGKSMLLEGPTWCLFGKTVRGISSDEVVNNKFGPTPGKNCMVRILLTTGGGHIGGGEDIEVTRYRKHKTGKNNVELRINGVDKTLGTAKETEKLICDTIGMDFDTFVRTVYFDGQRIAAFPTLTDKEVKAIFERVLGLDNLVKVAEVIKKRKTAVLTEITQIDTRLRLASLEQATAIAEKVGSEGRVSGWSDDRTRRIKAIEDQINTIMGQKAAYDPKVFDEYENQINAKEAQITSDLAKFAALDGMVKTNADAIARVSNELGQYRAELATVQRAKTMVVASVETLSTRRLAESNLARLTLEMTNAKNGANNAQSKIGHPCGECGKPYTQDDLGHIVAHQTAIANEKLAQINDVKAEIAALDTKVAEEVNQQIINLSQQEEKVANNILINENTLKFGNERRADLEKLIQLRLDLHKSLSELPAQRSAIATTRAHYASLDASIDALCKQIVAINLELNPYLDDVTRWNTKRVEAETKLAAESALMQEKNVLQGQLAFLEQAYGRAGLKAHIIETVTPALNERANQYATRLTDGEVRIEFNTVTKNKDGSYSERFSVAVTNAQGADGYLGNSSGERKKIDLAIALALADLVAARASKPIDLWVADEIAESLDQTALERVVELLKDKAKERGTLLTISHVPMSDYIPSVMTVTKTAEGSKLSGVGV